MQQHRCWRRTVVRCRFVDWVLKTPRAVFWTDGQSNTSGYHCRRSVDCAMQEHRTRKSVSLEVTNTCPPTLIATTGGTWSKMVKSSPTILTCTGKPAPANAADFTISDQTQCLNVVNGIRFRYIEAKVCARSLCVFAQDVASASYKLIVHARAQYVVCRRLRLHLKPHRRGRVPDRVASGLLSHTRQTCTHGRSGAWDLDRIPSEMISQPKLPASPAPAFLRVHGIDPHGSTDASGCVQQSTSLSSSRHNATGSGHVNEVAIMQLADPPCRRKPESLNRREPGIIP